MPYDDIEALLQAGKADAVKAATARLHEDVQDTWARIDDAADHAEAADALRRAGQERDYYLTTLGDLAAARDAAEDQIRALAHALVRHYGVTSGAVAKKAGVSQSTAYRWVAQIDTDQE